MYLHNTRIPNKHSPHSFFDECQVCVQLALLHQRGIFHLDLSPGNIVLRFPDGVEPIEARPAEIDVYIIDMGSAKLAEGIDREVSVGLC